jgi:hypothetical protein
MKFVRCPLTYEMKGVIFNCDLQEGHTGSCATLLTYPYKDATIVWNKQEGSKMEFVRCPLKFGIRGIVFKCDLQEGHSGNCISLPEYPYKLATVMWDKKDGFE